MVNAREGLIDLWGLCRMTYDNIEALRGSLLAGWRLLRCHPFARGGHNPVPVMFWKSRRTANIDCHPERGA